ncbi:MAG TPA: winged helix-turn-helix transcriptional regulator [Candidatus Thermoplasmatota archaeon]|jgi:predicted transcriptional regulator|nr:winged helix-turn-helix transcriptional regulator [Candidatus Thermoplasmatota archaeon]
MRALPLLLPLSLLALALPALALEPEIPAGTDVQNPLPGSGEAPGDSGSSQASPPSPIQSPVTPPQGLELGPLEITPDLGLGVAIGVGVSIASLAALALAGRLGTRFVNSENVLENDARRAIFEYIKTNPGCHLRETASSLGLSTTNVLWHLRKLEESNLVSSKKLEGYKVFYPVEGGVEAKRMGLALAVLRNPNATQILGIIARTPGVHQREIARMLGVNHGTVRWHLKKLGIVQLVLEVKKGAVSMYYVSALGLQALERAESRHALPAQTAQPPPMAEPLAPVATAGPGEAEA